jgi:hypothetical protein
LKLFLSLHRQNESSGYPGRIPRGQDHIATAHFKVTFGWLLFLFLKKTENVLQYQLKVLSLQTKVFKCIILMATTTVRKPASFRLRSDLLERLRRNAIRENRTLNNYVESVLLDYIFNEPNETTKAALKEAMSGQNSNKVYDNVDDMFNDILNEE